MSSSSSSSCRCHCQSSGAADNGFLNNNILNMSPTLSSYFKPLDRTLSDQASLCWDSCKALTSVSSNDTQTVPKSCLELEEEIARLEVEIMHLERHLLCLYRRSTAFESQISTLPTTPSTSIACLFRKDISLTKSASKLDLESRFYRLNSVHHPQKPPTPYYHRPIATPRPTRPTTSGGQKVAGSRHRSLADHLGASCIVNNPKAPDRLSEDIVRCISSIYCKLANPPQAHATLSPSPNSSLSSSTLFSSRNPCDSWSPRYNDDTRSHHGLKEDSYAGPYAAMIQVLKIRLDNDTFNYAAQMLQHFRSLVKNLEKVDPKKMTREEKLAFWINIRNALVMHAYLAYGSSNRVKSASLLKAAYNVGGHCINASIIQSSILGIRSHNSAPKKKKQLVVQTRDSQNIGNMLWQWLQTLFSGRKLKARSIRHEYALEYPEPLVHFALCSGDYFDPAVRAYTARNIFGELKIAREEFIEASVHMEKGREILVSRVLYYFAKDMSMSIEEVIVGSLSDVEKRENIRRCIFNFNSNSKGRPDKCFHCFPHTSTFRYLIHPDLAPKNTPFLSVFPPPPQDS